MYCPNCKQESEGKFCPECGTKLIEKTTRMCPNCKIEVESKFCPECGTKVIEMMEKATATGNKVATNKQEEAETCYRTAQDYYYGKNGKQKDDEAAAQWYLKAAEKGHLESLYCLGCILKEVCEFEDAVGCFLQAAEQGHAAAQYELGVAYSLGLGTEQSGEESMKWYRKAAEQGHKEAIDYLEELGERVSAPKATKMPATKVAAQTTSNKPAETKKNDAPKAVKPAGENIIVTYYNTAMEYHLGLNGKKVDSKKAAECYKKAAEMGLAEAQMQLGGCYRRGFGVKRDIDLAFGWYHKAAEQGNGWAQYALGNLYNYAFSIPNIPEMRKWYKKASDQGIQELLGQPEPLTPEAIAKAAKLLASGCKVSVEKKSYAEEKKVSKVTTEKPPTKVTVQTTSSKPAETKKNDTTMNTPSASSNKYRDHIECANVEFKVVNGIGIIPNGTKIIKNKAFYRNADLTQIEIPYGVTEIGDEAFYYCYNLKRITIPNSVKVIGMRAFQDCTRLADIDLPYSLKEIDSYAFYTCNSLFRIRIPSGVTRIGRCAFRWCPDIKSVVIEGSATQIEKEAFSESEKLKVIWVPASKLAFYKEMFAEYCEEVVNLVKGDHSLD